MKKIFYWFLVISILLPAAASAADVKSGLIAVSVDEKTQPANVSSQAARCAYYMIFDNEGKLMDVIDNPYKDASGGAGTSAGNFLGDKGVTVVVAEGFGGKMINAMKSKGITFYELKGKADDAVKEVLKLK
ncbi:MAG: NifB/NifX family molybdenum-iron cluster-binding protein [Nitrospirota bacterium]